MTGRGLQWYHYCVLWLVKFHDSRSAIGWYHAWVMSVWLIVSHDVLIDLNLLQFICVMLIMSGGDSIIAVKGWYWSHLWLYWGTVCSMLFFNNRKVREINIMVIMNIYNGAHDKCQCGSKLVFLQKQVWKSWLIYYFMTYNLYNIIYPIDGRPETDLNATCHGCLVN